MSEIVAAVRAELFRLRRGTGRIFLLLPATIAALRIGQQLAAERLRAAGSEVLEPITGFALLADGLRAAGGALTFALLVLGALGLVRDRETGMLAAMFTSRSRVAVVFGKALALIVFAVTSLALAFGVSFALANFARGMGSIELEGVVVVEASELWRDVGSAFFAALPPACCAAWFALAISALTSTSGAAVATVLVPVVCFDVLKSAFPDSARYVFATYAPLLSDGSTLSRLTDLARGYSNVSWADGELMLSCVVPGASACILLLITALVTRIRSA